MTKVTSPHIQEYTLCITQCNTSGNSESLSLWPLLQTLLGLLLGSSLMSPLCQFSIITAPGELNISFSILGCDVCVAWPGLKSMYERDLHPAAPFLCGRKGKMTMCWCPTHHPHPSTTLHHKQTTPHSP